MTDFQPQIGLSAAMKALHDACLSLDLEVSLKGVIHQFAAVRADTGQSIHLNQAQTKPVLPDKAALLAEFANAFAEQHPRRYLLGHNICLFDLPHLQGAVPQLSLLNWPVIDTLWLNPLAFPRNPYHHLVKHYQDGRLHRACRNDAELDARICLQVFNDQLQAFAALRESDANLLLAWHGLLCLPLQAHYQATQAQKNLAYGMDAIFTAVRQQARPDIRQTQAAISQCLQNKTCQSAAAQLMLHLAQSMELAWPLAYILAWLPVAGGNSVMPPWVMHQFPQTRTLLQQLRNLACADAACAWCAQHHNPRLELKRWMKLENFRPQPVDAHGNSLQQVIVEAAMRDQHQLGILPTGTGKSICYQVPALSRYDKTGALTVVVSPLVALMADQVHGMEQKGIACAATINGMLSLPERSDVLDRVRLGDIGILIISPEQLRSKAVRKVLSQREIGAWVLDEAHCISKWGHDFRPDYRYLGRYIKEAAESAGLPQVPSVQCLTATAKPDVVQDMLDFFQQKVGVSLQCFDGGAERTNLVFEIFASSRAEKMSHIEQFLQASLPDQDAGGAIIYCARRAQTEEVAQFLKAKAWAVDFFHAGLPPERKKEVQSSFIAGQLQVIAATNAFGMGIDKPNVRLVVHADIPGSLENYLQEAGRAGRDQGAARCILLYTLEDIEAQFGMSARSRLTQREIAAILRALKRLEKRNKGQGDAPHTIVATTGELLLEDVDAQFQRDSNSDDTRVRTALAWLEEAQLLKRQENQVQVFPSSLLVQSLAQAEQRLQNRNLAPQYQQQLLNIVRALMQADVADGLSTDELMLAAGVSADKLRAAMYDLAALGLASNDTAITAFVHHGVEHSSKKRLEQASQLEQALISLLREQAPDLQVGEHAVLHLRLLCQALKDQGYSNAVPEKINRLLNSLAADGRDEDGGLGSLRIKRFDAETMQIDLQRPWQTLEKTADRRRVAAQVLLQHFLQTLAEGQRGVDLLVASKQGKLLESLNQDITLQVAGKNNSKLLDRALLWLHEQEILRLNKGLTVFRPAMTIELAEGRRGFNKTDFAALELHYEQQVLQIHVMAQYVERGLQAIKEAEKLVRDYFSKPQQEFLQSWLPQQNTSLQTTPQSWREIVESLQNRQQQEIVSNQKDTENTLVLAGPGSGKTRVLVHRIAYLLRVKRENPHAILVLSYNRHAAVEIRRRLQVLLGEDARGVLVLTCHGLAMRLAGASFTGKQMMQEQDAFNQVLQQATALLQGEGLPADEADEQNQRLMGGFRWILVDEYQDIGPLQYALISALAGRTTKDDERRLNLFAVGDDDQNIYAFDGASLDFIRQFETDYAAKKTYLLANYRSSEHIIACANAVIAPAQQRMKAGQAIARNQERANQPPGGVWQQRDPLAKGRVQVLQIAGDEYAQALAVIAELQRLAALDPTWDWAKVAIIARNWRSLQPFKSLCHLIKLDCQMADASGLPIWRLRETQQLLAWLRNTENDYLTAPLLQAWLEISGADRHGPWWELLREAGQDYALELGAAQMPREHFIEWLAEWAREVRRSQRALLLTTAHRAKGLEFEHVAVLDGDWQRLSANEDRDAPRRLYYVAMTRAKQSLLLCQMQARHGILDSGSAHLLPESACLQREVQTSAVPLQLEFAQENNLQDEQTEHSEQLGQFNPQTAPRQRASKIIDPTEPRLRQLYQRLSLKEVDLGFAGRRAASDPIHQALAALQVGDILQVQQQSGKLLFRNQHGSLLGTSAKALQIPEGMYCVQAQLAAMIVWRRADTEEAYRQNLLCEQWEVLVPELVWALIT